MRPESQKRPTLPNAPPIATQRYMSIKKLRPTSDNFAEHQQESSALKSSGGSPFRGSANSIAGKNVL
jgi:hypothetical protein